MANVMYEIYASIANEPYWVFIYDLSKENYSNMIIGIMHNQMLNDRIR